MKRMKKVLSLLLVLTMLLPLCAMEWPQVSAEEGGQEMAVSHYFGNAEGDWETWGGNTNLVLNFSGVDTAMLKRNVGSASYAYTWYFTVGGSRYQIQPRSEHTFNSNQMLMRFSTIEDGFYPMVGVEYEMKIEVYQGTQRIYWGEIDHVINRISHPVIKNATCITTSHYGSGMENYKGAQAYNGYATEILFKVKDSAINCKKLVMDREDYIWTLHFANPDECFSLTLQPASYYAFSDSEVIYRFEPCVCDTPFIPQRDRTYYIGLTIRSLDGQVLYYADSYKDGYRLSGEEPIVPEDLSKTVTWVVDGVQETSTCIKGKLPVYPGGVPQKAADARYTYVFNGWIPEVTAVTEDVTYTAVFDRVVNSYPITWKVDGESYTTYADYGSIPVCPVEPEKMGDADTVYLFDGWQPAIGTVTGAAEYTASFRKVSLSGQFRLAIHSGSAQVGRDVTVTVTLEDPPPAGIYGYSFTLCYDPDALTVQSRRIPLEYGYSAVKTVAPGQLRFQWTDIETPLAAGSVLASVTFRLTAAAAESGGSPVQIRFCSPYDSIYSLDGKTLLDQECYTVPGRVGVVPFISGDVNGDGIVSIADITALLQYLANHETKLCVPEMLDVTGEGSVNIMDVSRLLRYLSDPQTPIYSDHDPLTHKITYRASYGGRVEGLTEQIVPVKGISQTVEAKPVSQLYSFAYWSDGVTDASREDRIGADTEVTAVFTEKPLELDVASLYIETENGVGITSRDTYVGMTLSIGGSNTPSYNFTGCTGKIRGRGNSSWDYFKNTKPSYRIKLDSKKQLLGVGKGADKDWILLTTYSDLSMLRNPLAWELGRMFDAVPYATSYTFVHVYLNGEYRGVYILCDQVESGSSRIAIDDESTALDKGYLIEMDSRASGEGVQGLDWFTIKGGQKPFVIKSDVYSKEECAYAQKLVQELHDALMSGERERVEQVCYLDSLVDMFIIEEITKDRDVGFASFYFYRDTGDKFYFAAPWDFDLGLGNDSAFPYTDGLVTDSGSGNYWFQSLMQQEWFRALVAARLQEVAVYLDYAVEELYAYAEALADAAAQNYQRWQVLGTNTFLSPSSVWRLQTFEEHVEYLVNWTTERFAWLQGYFESDLPKA